jgi:hypothetical protein
MMDDGSMQTHTRRGYSDCCSARVLWDNHVFPGHATSSMKEGNQNSEDRKDEEDEEKIDER